VEASEGEEGEEGEEERSTSAVQRTLRVRRTYEDRGNSFELRDTARGNKNAYLMPRRSKEGRNVASPSPYTPYNLNPIHSASLHNVHFIHLYEATSLPSRL
jgi:hypothetical protein